MSAAIVAFGAVSALGEGREAAPAGTIGAPAALAIARDEELARAGLARPFVARARVPPVEDRATWLLERALHACVVDLDAARPGWRAERVGLVLGTSSGGMRAAEQAFASMANGDDVADPERATYFGPMARAARSLGFAVDPAVLVLGACASSVISLGLATRALARGDCDVVLAGGFDDVTVFVASGFEALRATTTSPPPRPFRLGRDGMALGEGAAVLALARAAPRAIAYVTGFGAASDAFHLTAPDREGAGLARAATAALAEAGRPRVDLVSPHGTATPFNDSAEAKALARALAGQRDVPVVHPLKAQIGHTLGAAGALESLACVDAITRGVLPAAAGEGELDPEAPARLLAESFGGTPRTALKLACAFGGANAALVVARDPAGPVRPQRAAFLRGAVAVRSEPSPEDLAAATGLRLDRLVRADGLVRLAIAAVARLEASCGSLAGAGLVVGTALATVETNALFARPVREKGGRAAEPRRFPYTSPNAVAGECSIAFGLTGPSFSVGGGLHAGLEALVAGTWLVGAGDANRVVVVAVDEGGSATRALAGDAVQSGAVAVLLDASAEGALARIGAMHVVRGRPVAPAAGVAAGHAALLPLISPASSASTPASLPAELVSAAPPDSMAVVRLEPL
ncbi:MAG TPA: beta-ketoacyl synthase N-terminal-like domain-containing protein [Polyangiaceae bacterium]